MSNINHNIVSGTIYAGQNQATLEGYRQAAGFKSYGWCTFFQAKTKGWKVKKGSKAARVFNGYRDIAVMKDDKAISEKRPMGWSSVFNEDCLEKTETVEAQPEQTVALTQDFMSQFEVLAKLQQKVEGTGHIKIENGAYTPLSVELIWNENQSHDGEYRVYSMAHYSELNGDLMADPEMEIKVYKDGKTQALSYRNDYLGHSSECKDNSFLNTWLKNIKDQGFLTA